MRFETRILPLDLDLTLGCGQTFRWRKHEDGSWQGVLGDQLVRLEQRGQVMIVEAAPDRTYAEEKVREHFRASDDIPAIQRALGKDPILARGMSDVRGLRIVKMDEWECLISFVLATYANIPRITKMIETLADRYGEELAEGVHSFPMHRRLSKATRPELARCGLGYRAKYVRELSARLDDDAIEGLKKLRYENLRNELKGLPGVGDKVADCVSLFGFGRLEAFPIDVWMERALARLYRQKGSYAKLRAFAGERFGPYAGYAQEYLYYNERVRASRGACGFSEER